jgi:hypothetical protein
MVEVTSTWRNVRASISSRGAGKSLALKVPSYQGCYVPLRHQPANTKRHIVLLLNLAEEDPIDTTYSDVTPLL